MAQKELETVAVENQKSILEEIPQQKELYQLYELADNLLMKKYVSHLAEYDIVPIEDSLEKIKVSEITRFFKLNRIVYDKQENNQEKLLNVYHSLYTCGGSAVLLLKSDGRQIDFYLGTKPERATAGVCQTVLQKSLEGNFPGTSMKLLRDPETEKIVDGIFQNDDGRKKSVAAVTGIASLREGRSIELPGFAQGMEKMVDSMRGEVFSLLIIADPIKSGQLEKIRNGYENLYSQLKPFDSTELTFGQNESVAVTESLTKGISDSITQNLAMTTTHSKSQGESTSSGNSKSINGGTGVMVPFGGVMAGFSKGVTDTHGTTITEGRSHGETKSNGNTQTTSNSAAQSNMQTNGTNKSYQIRLENKAVKTLLDRIDTQLKRLDACRDLGIWDCAAYVIADDPQTSQVVASTYQALMRGKNSGTENAAVTIWHDSMRCEEISSYLKKMHHPLFRIGDQPLMEVSPAAMLTGEELTIAAGLPQKSLPGLPAYEFAVFGREIIWQTETVEKKIKLGKIYHMGQDEPIDAELDCDSLTSHTFITGSTGTGKSNTIYKILQALGAENIPFLVIEPAKGEYKHIFAQNPKVAIYGTNSKKTPLLKINPFRFPADIHVLEHIDRLVEIFNVCWPMYAAMPAVLKSAIEKSYQRAGWDLDISENRHGMIFPCFVDLLETLQLVIKESAFSEEVKSNYCGALITRVKSLTNGINGQVFVSQEIDDKALFDNAVIVDLSRVASMETKALLMGILVMRLQEYRMAQGGMDCSLRHVTVLEEAHNLLKRTSTEQSNEGANMLGKSVEMLANSIAEMRTFGEGFIIADQSPTLLDLSVIRNTNTKIILRLPALEDRELVGRSASLNDNQVEELIKLPTGVAVVYQNNWLQPVLCHIDEAPIKRQEYRYIPQLYKSESKLLKETLLQCLLGRVIGEKVWYSFNDLKLRVLQSNMSTKLKLSLIDVLKNSPKKLTEVSSIIAGLFPVDVWPTTKTEEYSIKEWNQYLMEEAGLVNLDIDNTYRIVALQCIIREKCVCENMFYEIYGKWTEYMRSENNGTINCDM